MTEDEAKLKWCPYTGPIAQLHTPIRMEGGVVTVTGDGRKVGCNCLGTECMAWRWSRAKETKDFLDAVRDAMAEKNIDFKKATQVVYKERGSTFDQIEGYCGAFGKPE